MEILHSKILGEGKPLVILHGYFGMGDNWKSHGNKLAENFQVHLIDQRNHGRSFHSDNFDYDLMVEDLVNYFEHHSINSACVLGHSMGGKTAMLFAVNFPEKVNKLIVADIGPKYYPPHHDSILTALAAVDFSRLSLRTEVDTILKKFIDEVGVRQFLLKNVYRKSKDLMGFRFNLESLTENNNEVGAALPSYSEYEGKVLFLKGENSGYIVADDATLIQAHFPQAEIHTISNAGHWLHAENPIEFYEKLNSFISKDSEV